MSTALLIAAVIVAALACPAMMWWQTRRGGAVTCRALVGRDVGEDQPNGVELAELRRRQAVLAARLAALQQASSVHRLTAPSRER